MNLAKDRAIELSGDPGFERIVKSFATFKSKVI